MPFQFAGVGIEGNDAIGVQVVAGTDGAIEIGRRIAGAPEQRIQIGGVGSGHPGGAPAAFVVFSRPAFGAGFAGSGNGPEAPLLFSGFGVVGGHETAHAIVTAGGAGQNCVVNDQRSAGGSVISVAVGVGRVPEQMAGAGIEAEQVGVVGE